jgi:serine/threonine-protein kinase
VTWFKNACGALAKSPRGSYGASWGNNRTLAEDSALQVCSQYDRECQVLRWVCTSR